MKIKLEFLFNNYKNLQKSSILNSQLIRIKIHIGNIKNKNNNSTQNLFKANKEFSEPLG